MIAIIDYKAGNAPSVLHAVTHLGYEATLVHHPENIAEATHIILPGVGSAEETMKSLKEMGFISVLEEMVLHRKTLFLGICVGLQVLFEHSEEGNVGCLGWLAGRVIKFDASKVRVPQMGWNQVKFIKTAPFKVEDDFFYFVNSYYAEPKSELDLWGITEYDRPFAAAVHRDNIYATQFHIEKSDEAGLALLKNFLNLKNGGKVC